MSKFKKIFEDILVTEAILKHPIKRVVPRQIYIGKMNPNNFNVEVFRADPGHLHTDFQWTTGFTKRFRVTKQGIGWWEEPTEVEKEQLSYFFPGIPHRMMTGLYGGDFVNEQVLKKPMTNINDQYLYLGKVNPKNGNVQIFKTINPDVAHNYFDWDPGFELKFRIKGGILGWWETPSQFIKDQIEYWFPGIEQKHILKLYREKTYHSQVMNPDQKMYDPKYFNPEKKAKKPTDPTKRRGPHHRNAKAGLNQNRKHMNIMATSQKPKGPYHEVEGLRNKDGGSERISPGKMQQIAKKYGINPKKLKDGQSAGLGTSNIRLKYDAKNNSYMLEK